MIFYHGISRVVKYANDVAARIFVVVIRSRSAGIRKLNANDVRLFVHENEFFGYDRAVICPPGVQIQYYNVS